MSMSECSSALCQKTVQHVMEFNGRKGDWLCLWQVLHPPDDWNRGGDFRIWLFLWREKSWLSSKSRDFSMPLFCVSPTVAYERWPSFWNISVLCSWGCYLDSYEFKTIKHRENENLFYNLSIWAVVFLFRMGCVGVCVCPLQ